MPENLGNFEKEEILYDLYVSSKASNGFELYQAGINRNQVQVRGLIDSETYKFKLAAYNEEGSSDQSESLELEVGYKPEPPKLAQLTNLETSQISIKFEEGESNGSPILKNDVYVRDYQQRYVKVTDLCKSSSQVGRCILEQESLLIEPLKLEKNSFFCMKLVAENKYGRSD